MTNSIRRFLLIYVLAAVFFITSLSAIGDYYLSQDDVRAHMDALLEQMGLSFAAVVSSSLEHKAGLNEIDAEIDSIEHETRYLSFISNTKTRNLFLTQTKYYFQLWNTKGKLLLSSTSTHNINFDIVPPGLSDLYIKNIRWRIFRIYDPENKMNYIVGERYIVRNQLLHRIALNNFYIIVITFPIAMLLIWLIVGRGFKSVRRITNEVSNRAPSYLEPVNIQDVPLEIKPLIIGLNSLFEKLREAFEREKRFASDAAHELRTPLAALKTQVQVALKSVDLKEREALFESLVPAVDRVTHIVQQLLTLSRLVPEAASVYDIVDINLSKIAVEIIAQLVPSALEKNIEIALDAPPSSLIKGNLTGISILIRNLVDNAIRYTPQHGKVNIEITESTRHILLRVIDTGQGIPEELHTRVFERFYRVIGNNVPGSGLGLAIVQQIAEIHQAEVCLLTPHENSGLIVEVKFNKILNSS